MIENRYINRIIIGLVAAALVFTGIFVWNPDLIKIQAQTAAPEYARLLFPEDEVITIDISADPDEWSEMLENALNEEYISCDITINGETYYSVGIRPKGNSSLQTIARDDTTDRYSFKIKMDEYVDGQTYHGLSKFVVNNMQADATYMKEYLSYDMMNYLGVSTPLYAFADLSLNGEAWGFYLAIEAVEDEFAQRNFGSDFGILYKPESVEMGGGQGQRPNGEQNQDGGQGQRPNGEQNQDGGQGQRPNGEQNQDGTQGQMGQDENQNEKQPSQNMMNNRQGEAGSAQEGEATATDEDADGGFRGGRPEGGFGGGQGGVFGGGPGGGFGGGSGGSSGGTDLVYTDDEIDSYSKIFDNAVSKVSDTDKQRVIKALKALSVGEDLEQYIDVDEVARYFAANTALVNLDSYVSSLKHNYYLYEKDGKLSILPWDFNLSFGAFQGGTADAVVNFPIDTPVSGISLEERPLLNILFENEEYTELYHSYLQNLVEGYFGSGHFEETINRLDALISDHVKNDVSAFYTYDQYQAAVDTLREFGKLRAESIKGQLEGTIPATSEGQSTDSSQLIDATGITMSTMGSQGGGGGGPGENQGGLSQGGPDENQSTPAEN
ncbi:CotH kinase family protein [Anoxybacterium hadale]|uniref:CotH kinase family protein n=1 Tax=Anoxybacterium hadale TaxID=3408580 RepID=UPI003B00453E